MAWTTPKTYSAGDILTAAEMNTYQRDNMLWLEHDSTDGAPTCAVYHNTTQTLTTSTVAPILFNSEDFDNMGMHSTSGNTNRLVCPSGGDGIYMFGFHFVSTTTTSTQWLAYIYKNGTGGTLIAKQSNDGTGAEAHFSIIGMRNLSATDYVSGYGWHDNGANATVSSAASSNRGNASGWAVWVGATQ